MTADDIITRVRTIINDAAVEADEFTAETDAALRQFMLSALQLVGQQHGVEAMPKAVSSEDAAFFAQRPDGLYYVSIPLPSGFLRFVSIYLNGWPHPVTHLLPEGSPVFLAQYTKSAGVANGPNNPVAFIGEDAQRLITAHAVSGPLGYSLRFVPVLSVSPNGEINLPDRYAAALAYYTASLYHLSVEQAELSRSESAVASSLITRLQSEGGDIT